MIESPLIDELLADQEFVEAYVAKKSRALVEAAAQAASLAAAQRNILTFLETRFGTIPPDLAEQVQSVTDEDRLTELVRKAASCADLGAFGREVKR